MDANNLHNLSKDDLVVGYREVVRAINREELRCVILAADSDDLIKSSIVTLARNVSIPVLSYINKAKLGEDVHIDVNCAVVGIKKSNKQPEHNPEG